MQERRQPGVRRRRAAAYLSTFALAASGVVAGSAPAFAADPEAYRLIGDLQSELGCTGGENAGDWLPGCDLGALAQVGDTSAWTLETPLPAGSYEFKVLAGGTWDAQAWGRAGSTGPDAKNIRLTTGGDSTFRFVFDSADGLVQVVPTGTNVAAPTDADAPRPVRQAGSDEQFYFVLTDRFANGDPSNDTGGVEGDRSAHGFDPADKAYYHGGDLAGLRANLDYIEGLGTTALWLTPTFKNRAVGGTGTDQSAGYHGYWVTDFTQVDPHLGTNAELEALIDDAHARGIKVYFDIIVNHTADIIDYEEGVYTYRPTPGEPYTPFIPVGFEDIKVPAWLNDTSLYNNRGNSTWQGESAVLGDFNGLDDLDTKKPEVVQGFIDIYEAWATSGIDGFRIDTAKHVDFSFWQQWTTAIKAATASNPDFFMFGEVYDADPVKLSPYLRDSDMDSVLDFTFQDAAAVFAGGGKASNLSTLFAGDDRYTTATKNAHSLPTYLGSHDIGRIGYFVRNEDDAEKRSGLAHSLMYLTRGQPVVYYGDEQGFVGSGDDGKDKAARQSLFASQVEEFTTQKLLDGTVAGSVDRYDTDAALYTHIADLAKLRADHRALSAGAQIEQHADSAAGIYAFSRVDETAAAPHEYVVAVNNATTEKSATFTALTPGATFAGLSGTTTDVTSASDGTVTVTVPALSAIVLRATTPVVADDAPVVPVFTSPAAGGGVRDEGAITVDLGTDRYAETTFWARLAGADEWTLLGTDDTTTPRIYLDTDDYAPGSLLELRAVARDAAGELTQTVMTAVVGDDHGLGYAAGSDELQRLTIPGSHGTEIGGCADWTPGCESTALTLQADGTFQGTFDIAAGTYDFKFAYGTTWGNDYGPGGAQGGQKNYSYTHAGGPVTFFFDPVTKLGAHTAEGRVLTVAGDFQTQLGCAADWTDACLAGQLELRKDGTYRYVLDGLTPGGYELKVIENLDWSTSYGTAAGGNINFEITAEDPAAVVTLDPTTNAVTVETGAAPQEGPEPQRDITVNIAGSLNSEMGCAGDWSPDCADGVLTQQVGSVFSGTFTLPAGSYEYKVAIDGSWDENYGADRTQGSGNIPLVLAEETDVTFVYDDASHFVDAIFAGGPSRVAVIAGTLQDQLGCAGVWDPKCLGSWLQNHDRDGQVYVLQTNRLKKGSYSAKAALDLGWAESYPDSDLNFTVPKDYATMNFRLDLTTKEFTAAADTSVAGEGSRAYWLDERTLAVPASAAAGAAWTLRAAADGGMSARKDGIAAPAGTTVHELTALSTGLPATLRTAYPHLATYAALELPAGVDRAAVESALQGQLLVSAEKDGSVVYATGVQLAGVLDDVYAAALERDLGATFAAGVPTLTLWAPTARSVTTQVWLDGAGLATGEMTEVEATRQADGTWVTQGTSAWKDKAFRYDVEVFVPSTGKVEHNLVTDPYSVALTLNSTHSVLVDLADPAYRPTAWSSTAAPTIARPVDRSIYELHIRDFSITDTSVPEAQRGTYLAFAGEGNGVKHLRKLAAAGLNTVHLLPSFDIATIEEDRSKQKTTGDLSGFGPASEEQQAAVDAIKDEDGFNWGYDPLHWTAPEGSYATTGNQDGGKRVAEYRTMVGALHSNGLQVVQDVVYNHTAASGQDPKSVLDRVVPGYYQRLSATGGVENSTCCSNVATENAFAQKLMVDSVVTWAREYKIDGFRFDLMGHHSKANMLAVREALDALTVAKDGVDGKKIYLYGEGWNFGEVADNARFEQATQGQLGGTGIGTFSDRLRDAVHGGSPVDGGSTFVQGFGTGLGTDPNGRTRGDGGTNTGAADEIADLRHQTDLVRLGLAGNLADYTLTTAAGKVQRGDELDYRGAPAGYASQPDEVVTYVDAHDNETLFDILALKLPKDTSMADRVRMNTLSLATTTLAQTPTFWHAGTDLLRSKSLDRDSYNSGDHFNALDWTGKSNNFGVGLPPEEKNGEKWSLMTPLLADPALTPSAADIATANAQALDLLRLRYSTSLLRLGSADLIKQKVSFPGSGADAVPGLLLMQVDDTVGTDVDTALDGALVAFNASPAPITTTVASLKGRAFALSPIQAKGSDAVVKGTTFDARTGTVTIPARTVALLVEKSTEPTDPPTTEEPTEEPTTPAPTPTTEAPKPSTTRLSPTTLTTTLGSRAVWTVRVSSAGRTDGGTVTLRAGSKVLGSAKARGGVAKVRLSKTAVARVGRMSVVASFSGTPTAAASRSSKGALVVNRAKARLKVTGTTVRAGERAVLKVRVSASAGSTAGRVTVYQGNRRVGSARVVKGSTKVVLPRSVSAKAGKVRLTVRYSGSTTVAKASTRTTLKVVRTKPRLSVTAPDARVHRSAYVTVRVRGTAYARPEGTVTVRLDGKKIASVRLSGRSTSTTLRVRVVAFRPGDRDITVTYGGSARLAKASASTTMTVR
ncbi:pullulanase-type alpha-1,6-glucosidase [Sanguibacter massiliensis]|uniref:pullulanase-type alpha-1,6-glucosidase n=1 Tax=Sanguibacter massiliensis TaxID=1973217 RepID=UPI001F5CE6BE|nr:pullulanase-type alpha-1,6-glucosidase [Sanguibacter massiliensis]